MAHAELRGVVALDGPSGTGKSTVARRLAAALGAAYLDTGAMYRAVTLAVLRQRVAPSDADEVSRIARDVKLDMGTDPAHPTVFLDGDDVSGPIREADVTASVSEVSALPQVRERLVEQQRSLARNALAERGGIVVEGRDIGTVVLPDAGLKVYLTAAAHARAQRRHGQDAAEGRSGDLDQAYLDVRRRDALDSTRTVAPLRMAVDAVELDTTEMDVSGVLAELTTFVQSRGLLVTVERTMR